MPESPTTPPGADLRSQVQAAGHELAIGIQEALDSLPDAPLGPQRLADALGQSVVLTSRVLKALAQTDPVALVNLMPGPTPLRRMVRAAGRRGAPTRRAHEAIDAFEALIRDTAGDRSTLSSILQAFLPEARQEFLLRRRQTAFKAMSELRGVSCRTNFSSILLWPAEDGRSLDAVSLQGMFGLTRLRPGVHVKFGTRRMTTEHGPRHPVRLDGRPLSDLSDARLDEFCHAPPAPLETHVHGDDVLYLLGPGGFGPDSGVDLVLAEVNRAELPRELPEDGRKLFFFHAITTPSKRAVFDVFVHRSLFEGAPELTLYDTSGHGLASPNDPLRAVDRVPSEASLVTLENPRDFGTHEVPNHARLLSHALGQLGWSADELRGYRFQCDYPLYGVQIVQAFARRA